MSFTLPPNPQTQALLLAETLASDAVAIASQFDSDVLTRYRSMYENYWKIGREFTPEQLQARSNRMDAIELAILLKAGFFVQAMVQMGAPLESKYHSPPYQYSISNVVFADGHVETHISDFSDLYYLMQEHGQFTQGQLVLGSMVSDWAPPTPEPEGGNEVEPT